MKDWLFYPLIFLIMGASVAYALSFRQTEVVDISEGFVVSGSDFQKLTASPGTDFEIIKEGTNPFSYVRLSAHTSRELAPPSAGVFASLTKPYFEAFAGKKVKISVTARRGAEKPSDKMDIGFFITGKGRVAWTTFELTDEYADYGFESNIGPDAAQNNNLGYLGIWPDVEGLSRTVDVREMRVEIVKPKTDNAAEKPKTDAGTKPEKK